MRPPLLAIFRKAYREARSQRAIAQATVYGSLLSASWSDPDRGTALTRRQHDFRCLATADGAVFPFSGQGAVTETLAGAHNVHPLMETSPSAARS